MDYSSIRKNTAYEEECSKLFEETNDCHIAPSTLGLLQAANRNPTSSGSLAYRTLPTQHYKKGPFSSAGVSKRSGATSPYGTPKATRLRGKPTFKTPVGPLVPVGTPRPRISEETTLHSNVTHRGSINVDTSPSSYFPLRAARSHGSRPAADKSSKPRKAVPPSSSSNKSAACRVLPYDSTQAGLAESLGAGGTPTGQVRDAGTDTRTNYPSFHRMELRERLYVDYREKHVSLCPDAIWREHDKDENDLAHGPTSGLYTDKSFNTLPKSFHSLIRRSA